LPQNLAPSYEFWAGTDLIRIEVEVNWAPGKINEIRPALFIYWTPGKVVKDWIASEVSENVFIIEAYILDHPDPLIKNQLVLTDWP
jgi:hypothetical protein